MRPNHLIYPALVVFTLAVFWQVHEFEFLNFDDELYVTDNPQVQAGLSWGNIRWAFTNLQQASCWHPLTWLSLMVDTELYGVDAGGCHVTNVALHVINVLLLHALLQSMTEATWRSACVALLFAIHPLHVESIAWISSRKDLLSTFFGLLAILAYLRWVRTTRVQWYVVACAAFLFSLMSKQMLVTLPCLLLLLDYWPLRRVNSHAIDGRSTDFSDWRRLFVEKIPFFAITIVFCVTAYLGQQRGGSIQSFTAIPLVARCANAIVVYVLYLGKCIWPQKLAAYYPFQADSVAMANVVGAVILLSVLTVLAVTQRTRRPYLLVGWLWFLGMFVPVIGIIQIGAQQMADRYTYIPIIGLFICGTWLIPTPSPAEVGKRIVLSGMAIVLLGSFMAIAHVQTSFWRDSVSLFQHAIAVTRDNAMAHLNLGVAWQHKGKLPRAIDQYQRAVIANATIPIGHLYLADALNEAGRTEEAIGHYDDYVKLEPKSPRGHLKLGNALLRLQRNFDAISHYRQALAGAPQLVEAHYNLALALGGLGRSDEALQCFRDAHRVNPRNPKIQQQLFVGHMFVGQLMAQQDRHADAVVHLQEAVSIAPNDTRAHFELGNAYLGLQKIDAAITQFRRVLQLDKTFSEARANLKRAMEMKQR